jgi:hypothetical protein
MSILFQFLAMLLAGLLAASVGLLAYYYIRKPKQTKDEKTNDERYLRTEVGLFHLSETSSEILKEVKGITTSINQIGSVVGTAAIDFEQFLDLAGIKNREETMLNPKMKRLTFNLSFNDGVFIRFGVLKDYNTERIIISSHLLYMETDELGLYKELLLLNGNLLAKLTLRQLNDKQTALTVEHTIYSLKAERSLFDFIINMLCATNREMAKKAEESKWNVKKYQATHAEN